MGEVLYQMKISKQIHKQKTIKPVKRQREIGVGNSRMMSDANNSQYCKYVVPSDSETFCY